MAEIWRGRPPDIEGTISNGCNLKLRVRSQCTNIWKESTDFQAFENPGCAHSAACAGEMLVQQSALHVAGSQETSVSGSQNSKPGASEVSKFLCQENQPCPMTNIFVLCSLHKGMEDIGLSSMAEIWRCRPPDLIGGTVSNGCKFEAQSPIPMHHYLEIIYRFSGI